MSTFFFSDPHAYHGNIMKYCSRTQFMTDRDRELFLRLGSNRGLAMSPESVERMNCGLAANINARVKADDTLWCLGDWCFGRGPEYLRNAETFRSMINCRTVHLIQGNHDTGKLRRFFASVAKTVEVNVEGLQATLNHYPPSRALTHKPGVYLHGHVHYPTPVSPYRDIIDEWVSLDVGLDGHDYQVWSVPEILSVI